VAGQAPLPELKVNFLATASGELIAEGHACKAGRSLVFVEGEVRDAAGHMLAKATGTFKLRYPTSHH
jgi:acyl-coenzyme A thioesterase PaaI-like protein